MKTKKVTVTMPKEVVSEVKRLASEQGRSFSNMVAYLVSEGRKK